MSYALSPNLPAKLLNDDVATTASGILVLRGQCARVTVVLQSTGTTSGGTVAIEEAYYDEGGLIYPGTWSNLATVNASAFSGGAQTVYHIINYSVWALRVRVATTITGTGTVSAWAWGN